MKHEIITIELPPDTEITQNGDRKVIYGRQNGKQIIKFSMPGQWTWWVNWSDTVALLFIEIRND